MRLTGFHKAKNQVQVRPSKDSDLGQTRMSSQLGQVHIGFRDLRVWGFGYSACGCIYLQSQNFPNAAQVPTQYTVCSDRILNSNAKVCKFCNK